MIINTKVSKTSLIRRALISLSIGLAVFFFEITGLFVTIDNYIFDFAYMHSDPVSLPITIVKIDRETINSLGNFEYWERDVYADLLDTICTDEYSPAVVGFDIVFSDKTTDNEADKKFAQAIERAGNVVLGTTAEFGEGIFRSANGEMVLDTTAFKGTDDIDSDLMNTSATLAFTNNEAVYDKFIRTFIPYFSTDTYDSDCFAYTVYKKYCEKNGIDYVDFRNDPPTQYRFSYAGKPEDTFTYVPLYKILSGESDARSLNNSIVLVGAFASGFRDHFLTPASYTKVMYGVEIHANIMEAIHDRKYQVDVNLFISGILYGLAAALLFFAMCFTSLQLDAILAVFAIVVNLIIGRLLYDNGLVINQFSFLLAVVGSFIGNIVHHYLIEGNTKRKLSKAFKMYVAPQIVEEVADKGDYEINLGGRNKDIAVLFIDIRGFTTMSENLSPEEVVNILNEYFAVVTDAVFKNKGTIDKFIGDACMAVFNSPFDLDDYVYRAVHTGWDILQSGQQLQNTLTEKYGRTINFGIGVNCGEAVIGNIGCEFRMDYTAIGDTVNTSSRLESNAKAGQLLISEEVLRRLEGRIIVEEIGQIPLKGKSKSICVYNVIGIKEDE